MEELEAIDWYNQRAEVCKDAELKAILEHNREEEKEHASMLLEWIRRKNPVFSNKLKDYLFTEKPIAHMSEDDAWPFVAGQRIPSLNKLQKYEITWTSYPLRSIHWERVKMMHKGCVAKFFEIRDNARFLAIEKPND